MSTSQINITLGTAGHIDHGKTVLIKCLTGCDTDRLKAEKERGMSIELGFAPCTIADRQIGIVDVPGHENFVKTMVAGATGIDGIIFVIAADDGIMPQSREHLDILKLLGVGKGIVALTKIDCVSEHRRQQAMEEVREFLNGTFLETAEIVPVSGITGDGFETFYEALKKLIDNIKPKKTDGVFRLAVERAFSLKGYGTVVTGIPARGRIRIGDEITLLPQGTTGRIKGVQVYGKDSQQAMAGQCAALNVPQWDHKNILRGSVVSVDDYFEPARWYLCKLAVLGSAKKAIRNAAEMKFHTGTAETAAKVYILEGDRVEPAQESLVQLRLNEPVVAGPGDKFILRSISPAHTVGGGMIIESLTDKLKRSRPGVLENITQRAEAVRNPASFVEYCVQTADTFAVSESELSRRTKLLPERVREILVELQQGSRIIKFSEKFYIHTDISEKHERRLVEIVQRFHKNNAKMPGMTAGQLQEQAGLDKNVFDYVLQSLIEQGKLAERKNKIAVAGYQERFDSDEQKLMDEVEAVFKRSLFSPPNIEELVRQVKAEPQQLEKILNILKEQQKLIRVEGDMLFHREAITKAEEILRGYIKENGSMESVKFKYLLDTTRKFAIPLLDYFDRAGVTRRDGYTRYLRKN